ncbi:MAG: cell division protein FtsL [Lactococcus sp.]|jgi:cell division protein FtsL|uniref:Cell division protein FtsL n=1 Tax=Pseudolactococcus piscium MKFS47 TaxID=297352 RepID=A0A0D6DWP0_9LACT|nr:MULTISPECIES: cell division protein FtsL [Lactococcus]SOB47338.1 Cell division protein FtsL [Lactococcus piscium]MBR6895158.1 cell division protein FtsL [Lactococcus sp.]MCJ1971722.1 cell division protein FtsL [Lactococcus carnosus]MCJ1974632.1 cell division protein FtsL [Lactococcus carnosus]MCJ1978739.1 cell division protein FtsL [Lactococcus carnosus]
MAAKPKEYFDIKTANQNGSYNISADSIAPDIFKSKFRNLTIVEKSFYLSIIFSVIVLSIGMVYVRTKIIEVEQNTLDTQTEVTTKETQLKTYDQKIDELMGKERVIKQANDNGIKSIPENVMKAIK